MESRLNKKTLTALKVTHAVKRLICLHTAPFYILCTTKICQSFDTEVGNTKQSPIVQGPLAQIQEFQRFSRMEKSTSNKRLAQLPKCREKLTSRILLIIENPDFTNKK